MFFLCLEPLGEVGDREGGGQGGLAAQPELTKSIHDHTSSKGASCAFEPSSPPSVSEWRGATDMWTVHRGCGLFQCKLSRAAWCSTGGGGERIMRRK